MPKFLARHLVNTIGPGREEVPHWEGVKDRVCFAFCFVFQNNPYTSFNKIGLKEDKKNPQQYLDSFGNTALFVSASFIKLLKEELNKTVDLLLYSHEQQCS